MTKKKTFRDQIETILLERATGFPKKVSKRDLDESTTPAAQSLITYIRQWPTLYSCRNDALLHLLESRDWDKNGGMLPGKDYKGKPYPLRLSLELGFERYRYGDQKKSAFPSFSFPSCLKSIPAKIEPSWEVEIQDLFRDINKAPLSAVKIIALGRCVKSLGIGNPHTYAQWDRWVSEWKDAQVAIDAFVVNRKGWENLTTKHLQDPKPRAGFAKELEDILARADAVVEPSFTAIREQDRRLHIRQDATGARNDIKGLKGFFKKYATPIPNAIELLSGIIDDVEAQTLNKPKENVLASC